MKDDLNVRVDGVRALHWDCMCSSRSDTHYANVSNQVSIMRTEISYHYHRLQETLRWA
jgi:hypothetical protein